MNIHEPLKQVARLLIDQTQARVIVPPQNPSSGHWFGGGNMIQASDGTLWLVGRYRNQGDSRTGLGRGQRGLELAIFRSADLGKTFEKAVSFSKADLSVESREVLSIEGSAMRFVDDGVELFVSTEKTGIQYAAGLENYLKPGTGVWTIDRLRASTIDQLRESTVETILETDDPQFVHVKDPFLGTNAGEDCLMFCTHPFCWSSSNMGFAPLSDHGIDQNRAQFSCFPRGFTWDVAMSRGTAVLRLPKVGVLADQDIALLFYDGGECVRNLDEHAAAVQRPRGYSCEELGGVAFYPDDNLQRAERLSVVEPMFVSPFGTGCSRYVDVLATDDHYYATWQQSQADGSQPLVMNVVARSEVEAILTSKD